MSIVRTMATDGNNVHAPDYHAEVTAEKIIGELESSVISVADTAIPETVRASRNLRKAIEGILMSHHQKVHDYEQGKLSEHGLERMDQPLETSELVDEQMLEEIAAAAQGSPFERYFAQQNVRDAILAELHHETRSQMNVHRLVYQRADQLAKRPRIVK